MNYKPYKHLPPFKGMVLQNFPFIEEDFDAITNYQLLCKVVEYLKNVIHNENIMEENINNLYNEFVNLKTYVDNYFKNLDVQEEINNKLDEMVEDGTFDTLLDNYLSYLKNTYIIEDIEYYTGKINDTDYFIAKVPHLDNDGNEIKLKHGFAKNLDTAQATTNDNAREFSLRNYASFCVNASIFGINSSEENYGHAMGVIIKDSQLISNYNNNGYTDATKNRMRMLGVKEDGSLETYPFNTSYDTFIEDNVVNTFCGYGTFIENGVYSFSGSDEVGIWNFICQNSETKDLYFVCCNGRDIAGQEGIKPSDLAELMINTYNCDYGFAIDGGGSTCFTQNGVMLNMPYDEYGTEIRSTPDYIYFSKEPSNNNDINTNMELSFISNNKSMLDKTYNRLYNLYNIHNNRLNFNFPNIRTNTESGIRFRYTKNDSLKSTMIFDEDTHPNAFSIYDNVNNKTVARIDGDNEELIINNKIFGAFFRNAYNITDANSAVNSGFYRMTGNASNSPYPSGVGAILIVIRGESGGVRQIIIPQVTDSTSRSWYTRQSNQNIDAWESWKLILTPTEPSN